MDEIQEPQATPKLAVAAIIAALVGGGGTYALNQNEISALQANVDKIHVEKQIAVDTYVYDMIRVGQLPDPGIASVEEITQAYVNIINTQGIDIDAHELSQKDLAVSIRKKATEDGETLNCQ